MSDSPLTATVKKMLWENWDPIGANQFAEASDEYDSYAPELAHMIALGSGFDELFSYLWSVETGYMGLEGDRENTVRFAQQLVELGDEYKRQV